MSEILMFPGLGLEFELNPIAFSVFGWPIHWYGIIIAVGFLLAASYGYYKTSHFGIVPDTGLDIALWTVPCAIIGARAYYVIFYMDLYRNADGSFNWAAAVRIWDGGLAIYGGIIVAVIVVAICCKIYKQRFMDCADITAFGFIIGQIIGRWGNFVNVEAYGGLTDLPWRMCSQSIADDLWRKGLLESEEVYQSILDGTLGVHPTFFYESMWNLIGFILLVLMVRKGRRFSGQVFLGYAAWYGLGRSFIEGLRTDSLYFFNTGIRVSQMVGIVTALVAAVLFVFLWKKGKPATPPLSESVQADESVEEAVPEEGEAQVEGAAPEREPCEAEETEDGSDSN